MYGAGIGPQFGIIDEKLKTYPNFPLQGREITTKAKITSIHDPEEHIIIVFSLLLTIYFGMTTQHPK